jgi:hypothetical protein
LVFNQAVAEAFQAVLAQIFKRNGGLLRWLYVLWNIVSGGMSVQTNISVIAKVQKPNSI